MRNLIVLVIIFGCMPTLQQDKWYQLKNDTFYPEPENKVYQEFKEEVPNQKLLEYVNDSSYQLRAYAFLTLLERGYPDLEEVLNQHLDDTIRIGAIVMGDRIAPIRVISIMLHSMDTAGYPLTKRTYEEYYSITSLIKVKPVEIEIDIDD